MALAGNSLKRFLEAYMREKGIRFYGCGGFTIESPKTASGTPDESDLTPSALKRKSPTDIVIEVIITSGRLDQKELYRPKKVPEVWFWCKGKITLFHLGEQGYEPRNRSEFFPDLDLSVLKRYLDYDDQYDAVVS